jgi:hypothetical protein
LPAKNSLTAADAKVVEEVFERRLSEIAAPETAKVEANADTGPAIRAAAVDGDAQDMPANASGAVEWPSGIDKSVLAVATPRRYRNREHLRFVAQQACLVCGRRQSDPHHLRYLQPRALGRKVSDEFAVPLCRSHHRAVHRAGDERAWWQAAGIDPVKAARKLWRQTRLHDPQVQQRPGIAVRRKSRTVLVAPTVLMAPEGAPQSPPGPEVARPAGDGGAR